MSKLTNKQQLFVQEYLKDMNATQAAIRAGYSEKSAAVLGHETLRKPNVAAAVAEQMEERVIEVKYDATQWLKDGLEVLEVAKREALVSGEPSSLTAFKGLHDSIGKHVDVNATRERLEVDMRVDHADRMEKAVRRVEALQMEGET